MKKDGIAIAAPCTVDWRKMTPADGGRFCGDCKKVVRDLSKLDEDEARALLTSPGRGELCVRYLHDRHGNVFFASAPPALVPSSLLHRARRAVATAATLAAPLALGACTQPSAAADPTSVDSHDNDPNEYNEVMGGVAYDPSMDRPPAQDADASADAATTDSSSDAATTDAAADAPHEPDAGPF